MPDEPRTHRLPELARSLRSLGAQRNAAAEAAHAAIFRPLLDARARASGASVDSVLSALRGDALSARIEASAVDAVVHGVASPAHARALTALAGEVLDPLRCSLLALDRASAGARESATGWDRWVEQLRRVFSAADVACQGLGTLIADRDSRTTVPKWFERTPK